MMKKLIGVIVGILLLAGFASGWYLQANREIAAGNGRIDGNTLVEMMTTENWQDFVKLEPNLTAEEREATIAQMGEFYLYLKSLPWNTEDPDPLTNGNAGLYLNFRDREDAVKGTWSPTYINPPLSEMEADHTAYFGDMIQFGDNRVVDGVFYEEGSPEAVGVTGGPGFGAIILERPEGGYFCQYLLPPGARNDYDYAMEFMALEDGEIVDLYDVYASAVLGVDSEGRLVLGFS